MIHLGFITSTKKYHYVSSKLQRKTVCSKIYFILESGKSTKRNGNVNIKTKTVSVAAAVVVSGTTVRPYVAATFLLKLSLCFLSGPTVLWNLIWKHRLCLFFYFFLLYHYCLATHVEQKTSVTQCQSRHKVGLPCIL